MTPRSASEWAAVLPRYLGMAGVIFCAIVWLLADRLEPALLASFGGLIAVGQGAEALAALKSAPPAPPPVPDSSTATQEGRA